MVATALAKTIKAQEIVPPRDAVLCDKQPDHGELHAKQPGELKDDLTGEYIVLHIREDERVKRFTTEFMGIDQGDQTVTLLGWFPLPFCEVGLAPYPGGGWDPDNHLRFVESEIVISLDDR